MWANLEYYTSFSVGKSRVLHTFLCDQIVRVLHILLSGQIQRVLQFILCKLCFADISKTSPLFNILAHCQYEYIMFKSCIWRELVVLWAIYQGLGGE